MNGQQQRLATAAEVAEYLGTTVGQLAQQRYHGTGPRFVRIGARRVMYRWSDVEAFLDEQTYVSTTGAR